MTYIIKFYPGAVKNLTKLSEKDKARALKSISGLEKNPQMGKKLKGQYSGYYSLRVWPYRIIYFIKDNECLIVIIKIGHRKNVYKK